MLEFIVIPHAAFVPQMCVACGGQNGPHTDTHRELHGYGRVYICRMCVTRAARAHGMVKGKRMNELEDAARLLDAARAAQSEQHQALVETQELLAAERRKNEALAEDNEFLANRVETLRARVKAEAESALELLGATADEAA